MTYLFASDALPVWIISTTDTDSAPSTLVVENFRQRVRDSSHTCWGERYDPGWYATAVAYLYKKDDVEFVPILSEEPDCKQCELAYYASEFAYSTLHPKFSTSSTILSKHLLRELLWSTVSETLRQAG